LSIAAIAARQAWRTYLSLVALACSSRNSPIGDYEDRDITNVAGLRRSVEAALHGDQPALEAHVIPAQAGQLARAHAGEHRGRIERDTIEPSRCAATRNRRISSSVRR